MPITYPEVTEKRPSVENYKLGYRGDIEGLRAVAILLVISAHAGVPMLQGGYIGVDIFFVLSGYLITGLLLQEIQATGKLRLLSFYARRLRRLLPALSFMLILVSILAAILLAPFEQINQAVSAQAASIWTSNLYFSLSRMEYFGPSSNASLFLHTWSLGLEEQFYLIWPVLLMFFLGAWHWQGAYLNFKRLMSCIIATIIVCFLLSILLSYGKPLWGFYLMPSRIWQFALGALVMLISIGHDGKFVNISSFSASGNFSKLIGIGGWVGILLIFWAALLFKEDINYPGSLALVPSVGAALVILAGSSIKRTIMSQLLSNSLMQAIGRISYSWYLWHWPILILMGAIYTVHSPTATILAVAVSLLFALFSYHVIEFPFRKSKCLSSRNGLFIFLSISCMTSILILTMIWQKTAIGWARLPEQEIYSRARSDLPTPYAMGCDEWFYSSKVVVCGFGNQNAKHTVILIGDSIGVQWFPVLETLYTKEDWKLLLITKSSCPMVDVPYFYGRIGREYMECKIWRDSALSVINKLRPDIVFLGSANAGFNQSEWVNGTIRVLEKITAGVDKIFIFRATHKLPFDGPACLSRRDWQSKFSLPQAGCSSIAGSQSESDIYTWLINAAKSFKNVSVLDLNKIVCPNGYCYAEIDGQIVFRDDKHLTNSFVKQIEFASVLPAPSNAP